MQTTAFHEIEEVRFVFRRLSEQANWLEDLSRGMDLWHLKRTECYRELKKYLNELAKGFCSPRKKLRTEAEERWLHIPVLKALSHLTGDSPIRSCWAINEGLRDVEDYMRRLSETN